MTTLVEWLRDPYIVTFVRWLLASIFLVASIRKLRDRRRFTEIVQAYRVLPKGFAPAVAAVLPWLEVVVGMMLLLGLGTGTAAIASGLLLLSFAGAMGINLARGRTDLDCGCFGARRSSQISGTLVVRNVLLALLSLQVGLFADGSFALDGQLVGAQQTRPGDVSVEGLLVTVSIGIGILGIALLLAQLRALRSYDRS